MVKHVRSTQHASLQVSSPSKPTGLAALPAEGYLRQSQLLPNVVPVSAATWWRWVAAKHAPSPVKLGPRCTAWRVADIRAWLEARQAA